MTSTPRQAQGTPPRLPRPQALSRKKLSDVCEEARLSWSWQGLLYGCVFKGVPPNQWVLDGVGLCSLFQEVFGLLTRTHMNVCDPLKPRVGGSRTNIGGLQSSTPALLALVGVPVFGRSSYSAVGCVTHEVSEVHGASKQEEFTQRLWSQTVAVYQVVTTPRNHHGSVWLCGLLEVHVPKT